MNEDPHILILKTVLADTRRFINNEIRDAQKYLWRRTWWPILFNVPLFASGCLDFYRLHYGWGIASMIGVEVFVATQWIAWNACLQHSRHWKKKWAKCLVEGEAILKKIEEHKERGFE